MTQIHLRDSRALFLPSPPSKDSALNTTPPNFATGPNDPAILRPNPSRLRRCVRAAAWLLGIYVMTILVLVAGQGRLAFPGWTFHRPWHGMPAGAVGQDVAIQTPDGNIIQAWWCPSP